MASGCRPDAKAKEALNKSIWHSGIPSGAKQAAEKRQCASENNKIIPQGLKPGLILLALYRG
jgi:hypothetical protein